MPLVVLQDARRAESPPVLATSLADGQACECIAGDRLIALYRQGDEFFALDGVCPHAGGPLAEGVVRGGIVTCPWHGWQYHLRTGENCLNPRIKAEPFPVLIQPDGTLAIQIDEPAA